MSLQAAWRGAAATCAAGLLLVACAPARALAWGSLGLLGGTTAPDPHLADYQWDLRPRAAFGAEARAGRGPFALGLRAWRSQTVQALGIAGVASPTVHATSAELLLQARVLAVGGAEALASLSGGRLHLGYAPDQVTFAPVAGGNDVTVDLRPVDAWVAGAGLAVRRPLPGRFAVDLEVDHGVFGLDTAHRSGATIVNQSESFGAWNVRLGLARLFFVR